MEPPIKLPGISQIKIGFQILPQFFLVSFDKHFSFRKCSTPLNIISFKTGCFKSSLDFSQLHYEIFAFIWLEISYQYGMILLHVRRNSLVIFERIS